MTHLKFECPFIGLFCLFLPLTVAYRPIPDESGTKQGDRSWIREADAKFNRLHVSTASLDKFNKYRDLSCREKRGLPDGNADVEDKHMEDYLDWEEIEFHRSLKEKYIGNEKDVLTEDAINIIKRVPEAMLNTALTSLCKPTGQNHLLDEKWINEEVKDKTIFEDYLINNLMWKLDSSSSELIDPEDE
ncbi:hypothetical protein L596_022223 [Steinernema carpocapsae]|uniref:Uncharacterized protein n=1 Tax=Steinernema carpocapsae TaxID=34508 RepID=A0A4U5ML34_STECR|nr:hypothetical protein L596_022223 [Steinernema carpocapsae]